MTYLNYQLGDQNVPRDLPAAFFCEVCSYYWISGSYSRSDEDTSLLGSYAMLSGKQLTHISKYLLGLLDPEAEGTMIILIPVTIYQCTWCNIPEDLHLLSSHYYKYTTAVAKI
jgi:hypothetical protein